MTHFYNHARLVRLSIPVWASLVVTILLTLGWPTQHLLVAAHNGSTWLAEKNLTTPSWQIILRAFIPIVGSTEAALINSPLWTIRYELLGSFLMILLVQLRKWHFWLHAAGCFLIYVFFFYPYSTFLLGHLLALFIRTKSYATLRGIPRINILTIMMLVAGIFLCQSDFLGLAKAQYQIYAWATDWRHLEKVPIHTIQWMIAADFIAVAIICSNWMQEILERPICQKIGQLSFSIYLLHFPILLTVTSALILGLQAQLGWGLATALALLGGLSLTGVAAHFFEKYCDRRAIQLSRDFLQSEQLR